MSTFKDLLTAANTIEENNLHKNEKIPEVIAAFKKCYDLDPSNEETKRKYLSYFKRQFELEHIKKNQEELKVLGNAQIQQQCYEEAVIIYNASIDLDPSIESAASIYSNRSLAFFNLGRFKEAEDDGCMAIFLKPEFARGYLRRGNAGMKLEKWKESLEDYDKYFELDPENAKSDSDLVKNRNSVKKAFEQSEAETRRHERLMKKTREELMAIGYEAGRKTKAQTLIVAQVLNPSSFDVDLVHLLVEFGADLAPMQLGVGSVLTLLLGTRLAVPPKILPQFDELMFFIIDEMLRRDIPFVGWELSVACNRLRVGPVNPKLLRVLLETNKFDVNQSFGKTQLAPLISLVMGMIHSLEMPIEAPDCLHLLLNWKGIDVNAVSEVSTSNDIVLEMTALGYVRHPDVAKILIRYGANVNLTTSLDKESATVLDHVFSRPYNPYLEELIRFLIQSGARLLANGRDGKSSMAMYRILNGAKDPETNKQTFVSEEVLQMILQLNQHQGFLFGWQSVKSAEEMPFFLLAICVGAPLRFVELLCAMTPDAMKRTGKYVGGETMTVASALIRRIQNNVSSFEESMQILGLLLDRGLDLFEPNSEYNTTPTFVALWHICRQVKQDLNLLKKTIIEKRGEEEFQRCLKILK